MILMMFNNFLKNIIQLFTMRKKNIPNNEGVSVDNKSINIKENQKNYKEKKISKNNKNNVNEDIYPLF